MWLVQYFVLIGRAECGLYGWFERRVLGWLGWLGVVGLAGCACVAWCCWGGWDSLSGLGSVVCLRLGWLHWRRRCGVVRYGG